MEYSYFIAVIFKLKYLKIRKFYDRTLLTQGRAMSKDDQMLYLTSLKIAADLLHS